MFFVHCFEVINYKTGKPLAKDDVGAKAENYNLLSVEKYQFFDEEKPVEAGMKISEIIYENISEFIWELTNKVLSFPRIFLCA